MSRAQENPQPEHLKTSGMGLETSMGVPLRQTVQNTK